MVSKKASIHGSATIKRTKSTKSKSSAKKPAREIAKPAKDMEIDVGFMGSREESADSRTVASRNRLRDKMGGEIEEFLSHGGKIRQIDPHVTADPPQRPVSRYGQRPI
ncbi:MAG: hypothetical protein V3T17_16510 [Pseudomonadales bacterium]